MTVEFVLVAPLLLVLVLFLILAGRVVEAHGQVDGAARDAAVEAHGQVDGAARDAARAASIARSPAAAQAAADQAVSADVNGWCSPPVVLGFAPGSQAVTVRLNCALDLSFISFGVMHVTGYAVAPLDQYVGRTYG
jgi:Flp pilus assembly protein TadG